jgi:hypothetical protein
LTVTRREAQASLSNPAPGASNGFISATANCFGGETVVGGGYRWQPRSFQPIDERKGVAIENWPTSSTSWFVEIAVTEAWTSVGNTLDLTVFVLCASQ